VWEGPIHLTAGHVTAALRAVMLVLCRHPSVRLRTIPMCQPETTGTPNSSRCIRALMHCGSNSAHLLASLTRSLFFPISYLHCCHDDHGWDATNSASFLSLVLTRRSGSVTKPGGWLQFVRPKSIRWQIWSYIHISHSQHPHACSAYRRGM